VPRWLSLVDASGNSEHPPRKRNGRKMPRKVAGSNPARGSTLQVRSTPLIMTCIVGLLAKLGSTIETQLKPSLGGISGLIIRSYLPPVWVFATGTENVSLVADSQGNVHVSSGATQPTDVLIAIAHDSLSSAMEAANGLRSRDTVVMSSASPQFYTTKGQAAFNFLRSRLGL
jgi:hypothetical protein